MLGHRRENQNSFHHGEAAANADARTTAERHVGKAWQMLGEVAVPPLRQKVEWMIEESGVAVHHPRASEDRRACRDGISADLAGFESFSSQCLGGRVEPQGFCDNPLRMMQSADVGDGRWTRFQGTANLLE